MREFLGVTQPSPQFSRFNDSAFTSDVHRSIIIGHAHETRIVLAA